MKINIDEPILKKIGNVAEKYNIDVFVVGGYVRDSLLNKKRYDIDCTVVGDSIEFAKIVAKEFNTKVVIYERFRTALVPIGKTNIEFVGTRKEEYLPDSRNPITKEGTLEDDLRRRDFTINAMAASIRNHSKDYRFGEVIDLFNGVDHLEKKMLITPLDPVITYMDDPLRMMRAARFASQLQFRIDPASIAAICSLAKRIKIVSKERLADEFLKIIASDKPSIGIHILYKTGLLKYVLPELHATKGIEQASDKDGQVFHHKDVYHHTLQVLDNAASVSNHFDTSAEVLRFRLAALFHDIAKPQTKKYIEGSGWHFFGHEERGAKMVEPIFRKMKLPLDNIDYIKKLIRLHLRPTFLITEEITDSAVRRLAANAGEVLEDLFLLCKCDITSKNPNLTQKYLAKYDKVAQMVIDVQIKDKLREFQSPVRGEEIMAICNIPPSKMVGYIKTNIENAILDGIIPNDYDEAKTYFLTHKNQWLQADVTNFRISTR